jgi:short chain dehydrogenase
LHEWGAVASLATGAELAGLKRSITTISTKVAKPESDRADAIIPHKEFPMSKKLSGKVAVVTGGSSGIGLGAAKAFAAEGARVVISGRNQVALDKAVAEIGGDTLGIVGDAAILADIDRIYATVAKRGDRIDVLMLNAGIFNPWRSAKLPKNILTKSTTPTSAGYSSASRRLCHFLPKARQLS